MGLMLFNNHKGKIMTRQKLALLCFGMALLSALPAHADHKLLATDVLNAGQFEAEATFIYSHNSNDVSASIPSISPVVTPLGTETRNTFGSTYSLGIGLGYGLQVSASIPYRYIDDIRDKYTVYADTYVGHRDGLGDLIAGLKYCILSDERSPVALTTGLDVKFYTADKSKAGSGTTDINPYLAASTTINRKVKPYAVYQAILRDNGSNDSHIVSAGVQYEINPTVTLKPNFSATFRTASDAFRPYESYEFELESYLQVAKNLYLLPRIGYGISTPTSQRDGAMIYEYGTLKFIETGFGIYYFFE